MCNERLLEYPYPRIWYKPVYECRRVNTYPHSVSKFSDIVLHTHRNYYTDTTAFCSLFCFVLHTVCDECVCIAIGEGDRMFRS